MSDDLPCLPHQPNFDSEDAFPPGGFINEAAPDSCLKFYHESSSYQPPFVATSFDKRCAKRFLTGHGQISKHTPRPGVQFVIQVNPRGEDEEEFRCQSASLITKRCQMSQMSTKPLHAVLVFTLTKFKRAGNKDPHEVHLHAAEDTWGMCCHCARRALSAT